MGTFFKGAKDRLEVLSDEDLHDLNFVLFTQPVAKATDLGDTTEEAAALLNSREEREKFSMYGLRVQIIADPGAPNGVRNRFLQLFIESSAPTELHAGNNVGIIAERAEDGGEFTPLAVLEPRDVTAIVTGEGFAVPLPAPELK